MNATIRNVRRGVRDIGPARRRSAFTLVEMLVVLGVIAILLTLIFPAATRAKTRAMQAKCSSNLHQLGLALVSYAGDHEGWLPRREGTSLPHTMKSGVYNLNDSFLLPYLEHRNLAFCPSRLLNARNPKTTTPDYIQTYVSYAYYNMKNGGGSWLAAEHPELTRMTGEKGQPAVWGCMTLNTSGGLWFGHDRPVIPEKPEGQNNLFLDGAVRWVRFADLEPFWQSADQTWYWPKL